MHGIIYGWLFLYAALGLMLLSGCAINPDGGGPCNNMLLAMTLCPIGVIEDPANGYYGTGVPQGPSYSLSVPPSYAVTSYPRGGYVIQER